MLVGFTVGQDIDRDLGDYHYGKGDKSYRRPKLYLVGNNIKHKLGRCEGDCDYHSDCKYGLKCFKDPHAKKVPGCYGYRAVNKNHGPVDYCVKKRHYYNYYHR